MKIFCIGLHKTGTFSLAKALEDLGFRTRHGFKPQSDAILDAIYDGVDPLKYIEETFGPYNGYADLYAVRDHFPYIHEYYPDAKFILTTRDEDDWVDSVNRQIKKRPNSPYFHHWYYQTESQWRYHKRMHENFVLDYFDVVVNNPLQIRGFYNNLLIMDITKGDKWKMLCNFLDRPVPDHPFPHMNKGREQ